MPNKGGHRKFNSRMVIVIGKDDFDTRFGDRFEPYDNSPSEQNKAHIIVDKAIICVNGKFALKS